ncbi:MAG: tRNA pseudouridine(13) synthase TruD [Lysobacteraceae bacterium]
MNELRPAVGTAVLEAVMRTTPEEFRVEELPAFDASGSGEHLLLTIQKRGMNTAFAAQTIARWAGVADSAVGYAGMKDRHAVTTQRFSVHLPGREAPDTSALNTDELHVVDATRHARKLQRGALRGNRFELTLRQVVGDRAAIDDRLQSIARQGFPNFFGTQRFGRAGANLDAARQLFAGRRMPRDKRGMVLSAARSHLFNTVLGMRVERGDWAIGMEGELWMLDGSHSVFGPEPASAALAQRVLEGDIHPTGPLWGRGELRCIDPCRQLEHDALAGFADLRAGLEQAGLKQERRALRALARQLDWNWLPENALRLSFELSPGSYATSLLVALGNVTDAASADTLSTAIA